MRRGQRSNAARHALIVVGATVGLVVATIPSAATAATAASTSAPPALPLATATSAPSYAVIVVLRNQRTDLQIAKGLDSPRVRAYRTDQAPLLAQVKAAGARNVHAFSTINAFAATVTSAQAAGLASEPSVAQVLPDLTLKAAPSVAADPGAAKPGAPVQAPIATTPLSGICPSDPAHPLLEPEALGLTNTAFSNTATPQAQNLVDGTGVKVAYIADGVDVNDPEFIRAGGAHVFIDYEDFSGEGLSAPSGAAESFGDASAIAAQGMQSYDLANYVSSAHPLPPGCNINIRGVAPGASLIGLKVFGNTNSAPTSRFIEAIDYAVSAGADVLNESFGANPFPDNGNDPITLADEAAVAAGVTVVASAGDAGTNGTIGSPASSGGIIGVAATTMFQSYEQRGLGGATLSNGTWLDDNISGLSSGGVTQAGGVPDLAAPGDLGWAACSRNTSMYEECTDDNGNASPIEDFGGTSQSSPLTAGAAALVIEAYENTHAGAHPTPALVKQLLTSTATDLGHPASEQGSGLLNSLAAVQAAASWHDANGAPARQGAALVVNKSQVKLTGAMGAAVSTTLSVKNVGKAAQTVAASTRSFEHVVKTLKGSVTLNTATAPFFVDSNGVNRSYVAHTFTVGASVDRLDVSNAANANGFSLRTTLIDPTGALAAYSLPQGAANFAHVDVRYPKAGNWTAYFALSTSSGFNGPIAFSIVQTDVTTHGTVTPASAVIAPGASQTFTIHSTLPATPSDLSASVQFSSPAVATSVPMTLRAQVPAAGGTFTGTITGGNGRSAGGVAQSNIYSLNVPKGKTDLDIATTLTDPATGVYELLTAPNGQVYSYQSDVAPDGHGTDGEIEIYQRAPGAGKWTLSLETANPVSGLEVAQTFTVKVGYDGVSVSGTMPHGKLAAGVATTVPITVKNTGVAPQTYFVDGRLATVGTIPLKEQSGNATTSLPVPLGVSPYWVVPTHVTELDASATADQPVNMDFYFESGDPDVYAAAVGNGASVQVTAPQVAPGPWVTDIGQTGPFSGPAPSGTVTVAASAHGSLFDPTLASDTGDFWQLGLDPTPTYPAGLTLNPGQTGTIHVTVTPAGPSGTKVKGTLYIDSFDRYIYGGNELSAIPYTYTVK